MQCSHADSERLSALSVIASTSPNTTTNSHGVVKQMRKITYLDSKSRRTNHVLTLSSVPTAKASIMLIQIHAPSGNITLTIIGITKNNKSFMRVETTQFAQP